MMVSTGSDEEVAAAWKFVLLSGIGAALVAETTGYISPNKAANDLLTDFYAQNQINILQWSSLGCWLTGLLILVITDLLLHKCFMTEWKASSLKFKRKPSGEIRE